MSQMNPPQNKIGIFLVIFANKFFLLMKKIFALFILLFSVYSFAQDGIVFEKTSFKDILAKAKKENKLVFLDAMASWCGPCKMMEKNVFPKKNVGSFYNKNFINATFDMEKGEGREIAAKYGIGSYPTYLFINGDGQLITKNMGYMPEDTFLELGKEAASANTKFGSMKERFEKGEKNPEFLINIIKLHGTSDYDFAKKASERYFQNKKDKTFSKEEASYLLGFIKTVDDPNFKVFMDNKAALDGYFPAEAYKQFENNLRMQKIIDTSIDEATKTIKEDYFLQNSIPIIGEEGSKISLHRLKINYYNMVEKFPEYEKAVLEYFQKIDAVDPKDLLPAAKNFMEKATNPSSLKAAEMWAEKAVMQRETADNTYVLAKLYQKNGKKDLAKLFAEASVRLSKQLEMDSSAAEKLLTELK